MRKEEKTELTRERILSAALKEFGEKGYAAATLGDICSAGISKGLIYHNFENKDALYLACVGRCFTALTDFLRMQCGDLDIRRYMEARLAFFKDNQDKARLFFEAILQPPAKLKGRIRELQKEFYAFNSALYENILTTVTLREGVTHADALQYFALMQEMFNGYFSSPACRDMAFDELVSAHEGNLSKLLDYMLYGIAQRRCAQ